MTPPETAVSVPHLRQDVRRRLFRTGAHPAPDRVGMEIELLPRLASGGVPRLLREGDATATLSWLRPLASERRWTEGRSAVGSPAFRTRGGEVVSFEPGGQIEIASAPSRTVTGAATRLGEIAGAVERRARDAGVELVYRGIAPADRWRDLRLQLETDRYLRLARYLGALPPSGERADGEQPVEGPGARMMLQTAAIHVHLDFGERSLERWRLANALVAPSIAIFANSPRYGGRRTGHRSFRAHQWRRIAPDRTGLVPAGPDAYLGFALDAGAVLLDPPGRVRPFRERIPGDGPEPDAPSPGSDPPGPEEWKDHLGTLYPEVRPRGHIELRCFDSLPPEWMAVPAVFAAGLLYDAEALATAPELLGQPGDRGSDGGGAEGGLSGPGRKRELEDAGRDGLRDAVRADVCRDLFSLALEGARRLEGDVVGGAALERARSFYERFTRRGGDPGDEPCPGGTSGLTAGPERSEPFRRERPPGPSGAPP